VLDLGCGDGSLLAALEPSRGVGIDFSPRMIDVARAAHPHLEFHVGDIEDPSTLDAVGGPFDFILLSDSIGSLEDVETTIRSLHRLCSEDTRLVIAFYSRLWAPVLRAAQLVGQQMPTGEQNWLSADDIAGIMRLADFEPVRLDWRQVVPKPLFGLGRAVNRSVGLLPGVRKLALRTYVVGRPLRPRDGTSPSATVVIPCRNEAGNIADAVRRIPRFCAELEIIFVEGHSRDGTLEEIDRVIAANPGMDIKRFVQTGVGKADAVRLGFDAARGDVLMILDADLTVAPEELPKFYSAVATGKADLVMGTRLVYPMEDDAMRFLNVLGNKGFSLIFTWLLQQRITDTLCGTKVLARGRYDVIRQNRSYFADFDPFGDFDLIFGAAKAHQKIAEVPVRYHARSYGSTQISRFRHGVLLARMTAVAYRKLKAI
jgi:hypothetical protein